MALRKMKSFKPRAREEWGEIALEEEAILSYGDSVTFFPYPKMATSSKGWKLDPAQERDAQHVLWAVSEKIHGANFALVTHDDRRVVPCRRRGFLTRKENFFGYQSAAFWPRAAHHVLLILRRMQASSPEVSNIVVFGELFGGSYPHPKVEKAPDALSVQEGIYYAPDLHWFAFDIGIIEEDKLSFISFEEALKLFRTCGLPHVEPMEICSMELAFHCPIEFSSRIPTELGYPTLASKNLAEGVVVRPMKDIKGKKRILMKRKIPQFAELVEGKGRKPVATQSTALDNIWYAAQAMLVPHRIAAARSKVGRIDCEEREIEVQELVKEDLLEELEADIKALSMIDREELMERIGDGIGALVERE